MLELLIPGGLVVLALTVILAERRAQRQPLPPAAVPQDEDLIARRPTGE